ncbi:MAG: molybdenum cofactor guanylyltransferase [Gemmatimonadetes bacterium]|jgi:molybdopterin-guanine dinucleotide biosynthesis protein A|nr:molybdenum cofactor guanylyltransferase [Gemmatimonadota bacterium]|tara:strand:+ start:413 stop:997 length:585 start_codon:yes stop_codon:yes gene_type:complete
MGIEPVHVAVLAGGQSRRMGRDKALIEWDGQPLIARVLAAAHPLQAPLFIVGDPDQYAHLGLPVHPDLHAGLGPIGGLHTALATAASPVLLLACDLPFLTPEFLRMLVGRRGIHQAIVPYTADGAQPLCALYEPSCQTVVESAIAASKRSMRGLLQQLAVDELGAEVWRPYDESGLLFANLNTPEEVARVQGQH